MLKKRSDGDLALEGIKVLDFTAMVAGPYCSRLLADFGAEVIKIEPPEGDHMRNLPPIKDGSSRYFGHLNAGKKGLSLNLKSAEGAAIARALIARADVIVENNRPGVMTRLGLDYETAAAINPRVIYCSISGYGQDGPKAALPAYNAIISAASGGDLVQMALDHSEEPPVSAIPYTDMLGGLYAAFAIQTALHHRVRTGLGQRIDSSLFESMLNILFLEVQTAQQPLGYSRTRYRPIKAEDGFVMTTPSSSKNFEALCLVIDRKDWLTDPLFATPESRNRNWDTLMDRLQEWTMSRSAEECERLFLGAGVPTTRYRTVGENMADPQLAHRGSLAEIEDAAGAFKVIQPPYLFSRSKTAVGARAPALGEHSETILRESAGFSEADITRFRASGNVRFGASPQSTDKH